jgi:hypothetical protein
MKWEDVGNNTYIGRARVPWGWLVYMTEPVIHDRSNWGQGMETGWDYRPAVTFVFDPFHWWNPKEDK